MKNFIAFFLLCIFTLSVKAQTDLNYYLPAEDYDPSVPIPASVLGYEPGEWHIPHNQMVYYLYKLAESSDRIQIREYARSYEGRPLIHLIITSPDNHINLEQIRQDHISISDPGMSANINLDEIPVVIRLGYGVHGNESSASNASILIAYYLAASNDNRVLQYLRDMVILLDPCLNPDGFNRHASWINMHKSQVPMSDPDSRGFREVWPAGRTNHYWFDLNRDWILVQQPETRGRVDFFHEWKPNIQTDHHEMGSGSTFFFQPGISSRTNPLTPDETTRLTTEIGRFHRMALDSIGSLYFTEEIFDDFYIGKGSSYPDINGGIGILFEQAGTRGFARKTSNGMLTFPFAIRNQVIVSLSSLAAAHQMKDELIRHQRNFYQQSLEEAKNNPVKAYVFGNQYDPARINHMIDILLKHRIEVYKLQQDITLENIEYKPDKAFIVPVQQKQYRMVECLFRNDVEFTDSLFYDISAWTLPYAFNLDYGPVTSEKMVNTLKGLQVKEPPKSIGFLTSPQDPLGYLIPWEDYYAPKVLYRLQNEGFKTMVASKPFTFDVNGKREAFHYGTIFIPATHPKMGKDEIGTMMKQLAGDNGVNIIGISTSYTPTGIDLGSNRFIPLEKPKILLLAGSGVSSLEAGEIWHLLDTRFEVPVSLVEPGRLQNLNLEKYNVVIMPGGSYNEISENGMKGLKDWYNKGGIIIGLTSANRWLNNHEFTRFNFLSIPKDTTRILPYKDLSLNRGAKYITGAIFKTNIDISHPVCYGLHKEWIPVFRNHTLMAGKAKNPYASPVVYSSDPLLSGYITPNQYDLVKNSACVVIHSSGSGKIISFIDNPNFRAYWYGTNKLFINSLFFGQTITAPSTEK